MNFYEEKQPKILKGFEKHFKHSRKHLVERFDEPTVSRIHNETVEQTKELLPQLPDVGGKKNQFIRVMLLNAWYIPFYKVVQEHGMSTGEYVKMITRVFYEGFDKYPKFIRHLGGKLIRSRLFIKRMIRHSGISREREYPKNWVYTVSTDVDDPGVLFKVEYSQCAVCEIMKEFGAEELMPYCNIADYLMAKSLGFGFENPQVLGRGTPLAWGSSAKTVNAKYPIILYSLSRDCSFDSAVHCGGPGGLEPPCVANHNI